MGVRGRVDGRVGVRGRVLVLYSWNVPDEMVETVNTFRSKDIV